MRRLGIAACVALLSASVCWSAPAKAKSRWESIGAGGRLGYIQTEPSNGDIVKNFDAMHPGFLLSGVYQYGMSYKLKVPLELALAGRSVEILDSAGNSAAKFNLYYLEFGPSLNLNYWEWKDLKKLMEDPEFFFHPLMIITGGILILPALILFAGNLSAGFHVGYLAGANEIYGIQGKRADSYLNQFVGGITFGMGPPPIRIGYVHIPISVAMTGTTDPVRKGYTDRGHRTSFDLRFTVGMIVHLYEIKQ